MNVQERVFEMTARMRDEATAYLDQASTRLGDLRQPLGVLAHAGNEFNQLSSRYVREVAKLALATYADLRKRPQGASRKASTRSTAARRARTSAAARRARPAAATA